MHGENKISKRTIVQKQEFLRYRIACKESGIPELFEAALAIGKLRDVSVGQLKKQAIFRALVEIMVACNARLPQGTVTP